MNKTLIGMAVAAALLVIIAFVQGGLPLVSQGLLTGGQMLVRVFPLLLIAFLVAGLVSILIPAELVSRWLGTRAGWKGPILGTILGALVPGGPFFFYPLMATLIMSGANVGTMLSFVAAKTLWNVARVPVEIAFVGVEITVIRVVITFAIPILVGGAVELFLPRYTEKIKEDVSKLQQTRSQAGKGGGKFG